MSRMRVKAAPKADWRPLSPAPSECPRVEARTGPTANAPTAIARAVFVAVCARKVELGTQMPRAAGQFCKVGNRKYVRYGFYCPRNGHLRRH